LLSLPVDTYIVGSTESNGGIAHLTVEHPDIPGNAKYVRPEFRRQPEVVFVNWGATETDGY
jgi:hypothetical protein